ncbi:MAG TPA: hypothetical protein VGG75_27970 [Trebonia sp.]|jgi:hypothetical protein
MPEDMVSRWAELERQGKELARVSAICTLLAEPEVIPDLLEVELYAYADQIATGRSLHLVERHAAYQGLVASQFEPIVLDIVKREAEMEG